MGFSRRMMGMMMGTRSIEDTRRMMADMMPMMMDKMGPDGIARIMGDMLPLMVDEMGPDGMAGMVEGMGAEQVGRMMLDVLPGIMDSCFSGVDMERRRFMLEHCRAMLDEMEAKYVEPAQPA